MSDDEKPATPRTKRFKTPPFAMVTHDIWDNVKICAAGPMAALVFVYVLTRNATRGRLGFIPASEVAPWYLSRRLGIDAQTAEQALSACVRERLLERDTNEEGEEVVDIVGWSAEWKRDDLTTYERERKQRQRAKKRVVEISTDAADPDQKTKKKITKTKTLDPQTQTQSKTVPGKSGTVPGQSSWGWVSDAFALQPMTESEERRAHEIIDVLHAYTGANYTTLLERQIVVNRLRGRLFDWQLMALAAYSADENGLAWLNKTDRDGRAYMSGNLNVMKIFGDADHASKYLSSACSVRSWLADEAILERLYSSSGTALPRPKEPEVKAQDSTETPEWMR